MRLYKNQGSPECTNGPCHWVTAHIDVERNADHYSCDDVHTSYAIKYSNAKSEDSIQSITYTHCILCGMQFQIIQYQEDRLNYYSSKVLPKKDRVKDQRLNLYTREEILKDRNESLKLWSEFKNLKKDKDGFVI